jgi:hypothetical protein
MALHTEPRIEERYADCFYDCSGIAAVAFGGVALVGVLFLGEGIPRVQNDVLKVDLSSGAEVGITINSIFQNLPVVGAYWRNKKPIPASDNVCHSLPMATEMLVLC